jgi:hypothetical protein
MIPIKGKVSEHQQQHHQIVELAVKGLAIITTRRFQGWGKSVGFEIAELRLLVHQHGVGREIMMHIVTVL